MKFQDIQNRNARFKTAPDIAVIGMGCRYPGAEELQQLWENILAKRRQFRQFPDQRLPVAEYYDPDPAAPDKTHGRRAAVIDGFQFDWAGMRMPKKAYESTDIVHWLALEVALKALKDAGYSRDRIESERAGVVLGNTLTGEQTRSNTMRLRWPFVRRALRAAAQARNLPPQATEALVETMESFYKSVFAPVTEDTLAGGLSNTIAGRICNYLDFHGGGYTVDGACSSSLIAIATAATSLSNGDLDIALAGGVDVSLDTFELIGFAKTGALTAQDMTVYDRRASGFLPGEGCGFVVLKRLADARADGDYIYAVLKGWGISSDGKGGITAPSSQGQARALRRAYERAGYSSLTLDFIEGHGTGTPVGDRKELEGIVLAMEADGAIAPRSCGVTSFKSLVGHTKAAAGVGGFIKAVMAVNQRVIPPTTGCVEPHPIFASSAQGLYPILTGEVRDPSTTLRAGVSAMGFGGINCHVTIESGDAPAPRLKSDLDERALLVSHQESELFVLGGASIDALRQRTTEIIAQATGMSEAEMVDLAAQLSQELSGQPPVRAAIVASTPDELLDQLHRLEQMLDDRPPAEGEVIASPQNDLWVANSVKRDRVAFLFPGQGSQRLNMARTLVERFAWARELVAQADATLQNLGMEPISPLIYRIPELASDDEQMQQWWQALAQTEVATPAICLVSLLWQRYLSHLGIQPVAVGGHSLGELCAFHVAGAYDEQTLIEFTAVRGQTMATCTDQSGAMASLSCSQAQAAQLLEQVESGYITIANLNSPSQTVISGDRAAVTQAVKLATDAGLQARLLPVAGAFHSRLMDKAAANLRDRAPLPETFDAPTRTLFSGMSGQQVATGQSLRDYFADQMLAQVNFIALVESLAAQCDLLLEVGPGRVLSGLVSSIPGSRECFCIESKSGRDRELNAFLGCYFAQGGQIDWTALYAGRLVRPFIPAAQRVFIDNPCERAFNVSSEQLADIAPLTLTSQSEGAIASDEAFVELLSHYFSERGAFLAELIQADLETLPLLPTLQ